MSPLIKDVPFQYILNGDRVIIFILHQHGYSPIFDPPKVISHEWPTEIL